MSFHTIQIFSIISLLEIFYLLIVTVVIGYIFTGMIPSQAKFRTVYDMVRPKRFNYQDLKFASLVAAPGIIVHELAHKFVALGFGIPATFQIWPFGLGLAIFLKLIASPLLIIAPGYVSIPGVVSAFQLRLIAFVGPLTNLVLWLVSAWILKVAKNLSPKQTLALALTKRINMILFIFNMIPIPPLDGSKVFFGS